MTDLSILPPGAKRAAMYDNQPAAQPSILHIFERALRDVSLPIERAREIYNLQREIEFDLAEREYIRVRSLVEQELEPVARDASNPQTKSRYATLPQVIQAVRPIYSKHGIIIEFDTAESPRGETWITVLAFLSHEGGYKRTYHIDMPADGKGAQGRDVMTRTHATGSAVSYGRRYLLLMIFNIAVGGEDDDGNAAARGAVTTASTDVPLSGAEHAELKMLLDDADADDEAKANLCNILGVATFDDLQSKHMLRAKKEIAEFKAWKYGK